MYVFRVRRCLSYVHDELKEKKKTWNEKVNQKKFSAFRVVQTKRDNRVRANYIDISITRDKR